jgi:hypothetical protein
MESDRVFSADEIQAEKGFIVIFLCLVIQWFIDNLACICRGWALSKSFATVAVAYPARSIRDTVLS